jgi:MtrB/PioB family decaheme-associated outer membrane protein
MRLAMGAGLGLLLIAGLCTVARAQVDLGPVTASGSFEAGAIPQPVPYTDSAKFQEYRDLAQQIIAPQLELLLGDKKENYYFDFNAINVAQKNEMYNLRFGEYGILDVQAQWMEIPHFFSDDVARTPYDEVDGNFLLSSHPAPPTATQPPGQNIAQWLDHNSHGLDLSLLEGIANLNVRYTPVPDWTFSLTYNFQNPSGNRPLGSLFGPTPGIYNITEILEPIEYDIYNYGAGVQWARNGFLLGFQYQGSFFQNQHQTIQWDNPDVWSNPTTPSGACANTGSYSPSGGLGPCAGQRAAYPNNEAHNFILTGGATLPFNTHLMASASYGWWLQDASFIPYTINSAVGSPALPKSNLGGDVQPAYVNATLTSNPIEPLNLQATYSYYNYDNQSPSLTFKNVTSINDTASLWTATSYPFSFSTQDIKGRVSYMITPTLAARFVGDITTYHNSGLEVLQQDKTSYGPVLDFNPYPWLELRGSYQHAFRDSPGYDNNRTSLLRNNAGNNELAAMRRFDEAEVEVNQTSLYTQVIPREGLAMYAEFDYDDYNYPASGIGLQHWSDYTPSVGVNYNPIPNVRVFSDFSWQATDWNLDSFQRQPSFAPPPAPGGPKCPTSADGQTPSNCPGRVWSSVGRDQGSSVDFGFDVTIPRNAVLPNPSNLHVQYTYASTTSMIHAQGDVVTPATNYPDVNSQFHELILNYQYLIRKNTWLNIGYYFNHFGENDFGFDNMQPWMGSASPYSTFLGNTDWTPYSASVGYVTLKMTF